MFAEIINYMQKADKKLIALLATNKHALPPKVLQLFSHILNAQHIWANRIMGQKPKFEVWEEHQLTQFEAIAEANFDMLISITRTFELTTQINYETSKGTYLGTVQDILFHVVNHSTYHRAQIASLLKIQGVEPPVTDYIILKREGQL